MRYRFEICAVVALVLGTAAAFWPVTSNGFIVLDDLAYLQKNPHIQQGFAWNEVAWAFRSTFAASWMPLTWLSHTLDYTLHGGDAGKHHLTTLLLHALNGVLLFLILRAATRRRWASAAAAFLFLIHPLQVESVAWAFQRRTVLNGFFWLLALAGYVRYARTRGAGAYGLVLAAGASSLMAKPASVTLPFALLILDFWPLGRLSFSKGAAGADPGRRGLAFLVLEKIPLFAMAAAVSIVTYRAQAHTMQGLISLPLGARVENALVAYAAYVGKFLWPRNLAVFYPHPEAGAQAGAVLPPLILLAAISIASVAAFRRSPPLIAGWLWFLGTLVPMIGLVQVGEQAMADRYMYMAIIGLAIMTCYGVGDLLARRRVPVRPALLAGCVVLLALIGLSRAQTRLWGGSVGLFEHALRVGGGSAAGHANLAHALQLEGRQAAAERHYREALALNPALEMAQRNLGTLLAGEGRHAEALEHFEAVLALTGGDGALQLDLGSSLLALGRTEEAVGHFRAALRENPDDASAHNNLGAALAEQGRGEEAIGHYERAIAIDPDYALAHANLADLLARSGDRAGAMRHYREVLRISPGDPEARDALERLQRGAGP